MTDEQGRRLIFFGRHAGYVGMIDCLHGLGQRMLGLGYHTPFMVLALANEELMWSSILAWVMYTNPWQLLKKPWVLWATV